MGQLTVINPQGSEINVDESSWPYLERLGYRQKTTEETFSEAREASREDYYSGGTQAAKAFGEGFVRGASFNLLDPDSEQAQGREEFQGFASTAGEITGIVAPAVLSGGTGTVGTLARLTPAGKVAQVAERIGVGAATSRAGQLGIAGAIEGVGERTGALVGAALAGDEVTPEAIQQQIGYGALFGFGAGVAGAGVEKLAKRMLRPAPADNVDDVVKDPPRSPLYDSPEAFQYNKRIGSVIEEQKKYLDDEIAKADEEWRIWQREYNMARPPRDLLGAKGPHTRDIDAEAVFGDTNMRERALQDQVALAEIGNPSRAGFSPATQELDVGDFQRSLGARLAPLQSEPVAPLGIGIHEVAPQDLLRRGVYQLGEAQGPGIARVKRAMEEGKDLPPIQVIEYEDGGLEIMNGRHRLQAAIELGRPLKVEVDKPAKGASRKGLNRVGGPDAEFRFSDDAPAPGSKTAVFAGPPTRQMPAGGAAGSGDLFGAPVPFSGKKTVAGMDVAEMDAYAKELERNRTIEIMPGSRRDTVKIPKGDTVKIDSSKTQPGGPGINDVADYAGKLASDAQDRALKLHLARRVLDKAPDLGLDAIAKLDEKGIAKLSWDFFDQLEKQAPDVAGALRAELQGALGNAAPKLRDFSALDVMEYHKLSKQTIEKLAGSHDSGKEIVALWATLKGVDNKLSAKAAKTVAKSAVESATEAAQEKLGGGPKVGGFKGWMIKKAGGNLGKKMGAAALGAHLGGPAGFVLGWAGAEAMLKGGGGAVGKTVTNAKRAALVATAKAMQAATSGKGRAAAAVRLTATDRLKRRDDEPSDTQQLVAARIDEALWAAGPGRERLADTLSSLRAQSPELAAAVEADARRRAEYLAKYAPRKPGWAAMYPGEWQYPQDQVERFARVHEAVNDPQAVLEDFAAGTLTPDAAAAFRTTSPGLFKLVSQYVMEHFDPKNANYPLRFSVSMLLGVPFDATLLQVPALQQNFAKPSPQGMSLGSAGSTDAEITDAQRAEA